MPRNNDDHRLVDENRDRVTLLLLLLLLLTLQLPLRARAPSPPVADIMTNDELLIVLGKGEETMPLPKEVSELDRVRLSPKPSSSSSSKYHPRALLPPRAFVGMVPLPGLEKEWLLLALRKLAGVVEEAGEEAEGRLAETWRLNM
eukprot:evm.model.NODE_20906_length_12388_cov_20.790684.2